MSKKIFISSVKEYVNDGIIHERAPRIKSSALQIFNDSNQLWKNEDIGNKHLPGFYMIIPFDFGKIFRTIGCWANIESFRFIYTTNLEIKGRCVYVPILFVTMEFQRRFQNNPDDPFVRYVLLHGMNHIASALVTNKRVANFLFSDTLIEWITEIEIAALEDRDVETFNQLIAFIQTIKILRNDDKKFFKGLFDYCFKNCKIMQSRRIFSTGAGISEKNLKHLEKAKHFDDMLQVAYKQFGEDKFVNIFNRLE